MTVSSAGLAVRRVGDGGRGSPIPQWLGYEIGGQNCHDGMVVNGTLSRGLLFDELWNDVNELIEEKF
jgi:hypothetical protein